VRTKLEQAGRRFQAFHVGCNTKTLTHLHDTRTMAPNKDVLTACLEAVQKSMLSVGSGDGSQQEAIVQSGLKNLQVTFYDSKTQVLQKYPHATRTLAILEQLCDTPLRFQVDATKLDQMYKPSSFDLIFFTFPHTGIANNSPQCVESNQRLLKFFLRMASKLLKPDGEIQITLKNGECYERWNLPGLLKKDAGLKLESTHPLDKSMFPGYKHRLTNGTDGKIKEVIDKSGARVYVFGCSSSTSTNSPQQACFAGKSLTVVQQSRTPQTWTDDELWVEIYVVLESFCAPSNVLDIRRQVTPQPDTRQMNRVIYSMEQSGIVQRHPPGSKSQKPRWTLSL
jgi:hypothetical protein